VGGRNQPNGAGASSNERVSDAQYSSTRRCNVVEEGAGHHGPNDRHTKIHHDGPRVEERVSEAANSKSEQDEDNE
jgi:hypothetical protein